MSDVSKEFDVSEGELRKLLNEISQKEEQIVSLYDEVTKLRLQYQKLLDEIFEKNKYSIDHSIIGYDC